MSSSVFTVEMDSRRVLVDRGRQEVSVLDEQGNVVFRDRVQVAAGSVQGLFSMLEDAVSQTNSNRNA